MHVQLEKNRDTADAGLMAGFGVLEQGTCKARVQLGFHLATNAPQATSKIARSTYPTP